MLTLRPDLEGLYLKLKLEDGQEFWLEELGNLTLEEEHLREVPVEKLCELAELLNDNDLAEGGCRVALFAAEALQSAGETTESREASLLAFKMSPSSPEAASGLVSVLESRQGRCERLEARCEELETRCKALEEKLEEAGRPRLEVGKGFRWNLGDVSLSPVSSDKFQLPFGINAWLHLIPQGSGRPGHAGLYLWVDKPATVKCQVESSSGQQRTWDLVYPLDPDPSSSGTEARGPGSPDFMPTSEVKGCTITFRLLDIQAKHSNLHFL